MADPPLVHVVVLNYNGERNGHLEYCLPSIEATEYENLDIVVVDNDSNDDSVEYIRTHHPSVELVEAGDNLGWAGGNNIGIQRAMRNGADYVLLANNDIRVHPKWIAAAVQVSESDHNIGFVGFDVYGRVRPIPLEEYEEACDRWNGVFYEYTDDFVDGMALFARTDLFADIGLIDETFWAYGEENDIEIRAEKAGYRRARTNIPVWHYSSGTFEEVPLKASYLAIRNQMRLAIKHREPLGILRRVLSLYYTGCYPFLQTEEDNKIFERRRPSNIFFNLLLITYCIAWNVVHLPWTLRRRVREREMLHDG